MGDTTTIVANCSSTPPNHSFVEHLNSARLFCRKCAIFVGKPADIMPIGSVVTSVKSKKKEQDSSDTEEEKEEKDSTLFCASAGHNFVEHSKSHRLYCTKCGKFEGRFLDIQSAELAGATGVIRRGAEKVKDKIGSTRTQFLEEYTSYSC